MKERGLVKLFYQSLAFLSKLCEIFKPLTTKELNLSLLNLKQLNRWTFSKEEDENLL